MKRAGIIGGMSWESTVEYYKIMNQEVKRKLGNLHSADMLIYSYDFSDVEAMQRQDDWDGMAKSMIEVAKDLVSAGAEFIVIATNTMHRLAPQIIEAVDVPLLHIVDATAREIKKHNFTKVALLGTRFTMEGAFYREKLENEHNIAVIVPELEDRKYIHNVIYNELCLGEVKDKSREEFERIIEKLKQQGAEGVVLGCTEIPLLIKEETSPLPVFDTSTIHAKAAVKFALGSEE